MSDHEPVPDDEILDEYTLQGGVRGKYVEGYDERTNIVLLDEDADAIFPNSESAD